MLWLQEWDLVTQPSATRRSWDPASPLTAAAGPPSPALRYPPCSPRPLLSSSSAPSSSASGGQQRVRDKGIGDGDRASVQDHSPTHPTLLSGLGLRHLLDGAGIDFAPALPILLNRLPVQGYLLAPVLLLLLREPLWQFSLLLIEGVPGGETGEL